LKKISHIGIAVKNLAESESLFRKLLGTEDVHHEVVEDQGVSIASFKVGDAIIELTEATRDDSPIAKFIAKRGEGIHHLAIEIDNITEELARLKAEGIQLIDETPKPGAHNMQIAFLHPEIHKRSADRVLPEIGSHK
jgi:methylmalonyl-CoA/ethylmalonyl-CoA epimerase